MIVIFSNPDGLSVSVVVEAIRSTEESLFLSDSEEEFILDRDELKQIFKDYDVFNYNEGITLKQFKDSFIRESMSTVSQTNTKLQLQIGIIPTQFRGYIKSLITDITNYVIENPQSLPRFIEIFYLDELVIRHNFTQPRVIDIIGGTLHLCGN